MPDRIDKAQLSEEFQLTRDIKTELAEIARISSDTAKARRDEVNIEKKLLEDLKAANKINKDEYDIRKNILTQEGALLLAREKGINVSQTALNRLEDQKRTLHDIVKLNQQNVDQLKKNEEATNQIKESTLKLANAMGMEKGVSAAQTIYGVFKGIKSPMSAALDLLTAMVGVFDELDKASAKFRMDMGVTRTFTAQLEKDSTATAIQLANIGVTADQIYGSTAAIAKEFGSITYASKGMSADMATVASQLGVSVDASAAFLKSMAMIGGTTGKAQQDMLGFTAKLSEAAGTNLTEVMGDIASATKSSYAYLSKSPVALAKAAVAAKQMGTSLASTVESSKRLLDFSASVNAEMEASVLLGQSLNLQKARELAYRRDTKGLNEEILRLAKESRFEDLDPFQAEKVASALGKSASEIAAMLQSDKERLAIEREAKTNPKLREQLDLNKKLQAMSEKQAKLDAKDYMAKLKTEANQSKIAQITQQWHKLLMKVSEIFLPIIDKVLKISIAMLNFATSGESWVSSLTRAAAVIATIIVGFKILSSLGGIFGKMLGFGGAGGAGGGIGGLLTGIATGIKSFGSGQVLKGIVNLALLGLAMIPITFGFKTFAGIDWKSVFIGIGAISLLAIVAGIMGTQIEFVLLGAAAIALLGLAMIPFAAAAWVASKALQNLASVDFVNIAKLFGVLALGGVVAPFAIALGIASPFIMGFSVALWALGKAASPAAEAMVKVSMGFKSVIDGLQSLQSLSLVGTIVQINLLRMAVVELNKAIDGIPDVKFEKLKSMEVNVPSAGSGVGGGENSQMSKELMAIKDEIINLRKDVSTPASITLNMDSQLMASNSDRMTRFRKGYGTQDVSKIG